MEREKAKQHPARERARLNEWRRLVKEGKRGGLGERERSQILRRGEAIVGEKEKGLGDNVRQR